MSNTFTFNFYGTVGQQIANVHHQEVHFDKDGKMQVMNFDENGNEVTPEEVAPEVIQAPREVFGLKCRYGKDEIRKWYKTISAYGKEDVDMLRDVSEDEWLSVFDAKKPVTAKLNWEGSLSTLACLVFLLSDEHEARRLDEVFMVKGNDINPASLSTTVTIFCTKKTKNDKIFNSLLRQ